MNTDEQILRERIEIEDNYLLRLARIANMRCILSSLEKEAAQIKVMDLPLWYVGGSDPVVWNEIGSPIWFLMREDAPADVMEWICKHCYGAEFAPQHPIYKAFYDEAYLIGNKVTPPKKYIKATGLSGRREKNYFTSYLTNHLGSRPWGSELPEYDLNGRYICR